MRAETRFYLSDSDELLIEIGVDRNTTVVKKATDEFIHQYHQQYEKFKEEQVREAETREPMLPSRAINALKMADIISIDELTSLTELELLDITDGIGEKTLEDIKTALADVGLSLKNE